MSGCRRGAQPSAPALRATRWKTLRTRALKERALRLRSGRAVEKRRGACASPELTVRGSRSVLRTVSCE